MDRKRARDRRRLAAGGVSVVTAVAFAVGVSSVGLPGSGGDQLTVESGFAAAPAAGAPELSDSDEAFIDSCLVAGAESYGPTAQYLNQTEAEFDEAAAREGTETRVIGRDGTCLAYDFTMVPERVNVIFRDGRVIWAGRF
jgi:hypothetical protein